MQSGLAVSGHDACRTGLFTDWFPCHVAGIGNLRHVGMGTIGKRDRHGNAKPCFSRDGCRFSLQGRCYSVPRLAAARPSGRAESCFGGDVGCDD